MHAVSRHVIIAFDKSTKYEVQKLYFLTLHGCHSIRELYKIVEYERYIMRMLTWITINTHTEIQVHALVVKRRFIERV